MNNTDLRNFIISKLVEKYKTKNYMEIGKGFLYLIRKLEYNNKPLFDYISNDLNKSNPLEFLYLLLNNSKPATCKICGKNTRFINIREGYANFCSNVCSNKDNDVKEKKKQTCLTNYGVVFPLQNKDIQEKLKQTCLDKYGVENPNQSDEIKEKKKQVYLEKYGVENVFQNKNVQKKYKQTCLDKYGVNNPSQCKDVQEKKKQTWLGIYGVENPSQNEEIKKKKKQTWLKKYGVNHPLQNKDIQEKLKQTCLDKYGVENVFQTKEVKEKYKRTCLERYGVENVSKTEIIKEKKTQTSLINYGVKYPIQHKDVQEKTKQTNLNKYGVEYPLQNKKVIEKLKNKQRESFYNKLINSDRLKDLVKPNFSLDKYLNVSNKYSFTCLKCNNIFESNLDDGSIPRCFKCFPRNTKVSKYETEIYNFLKENLSNEIIERSNRTILDNNLELDIYIPNKKTAIEFNGLYWHSELNGKKSNYHIDKTLQCWKEGIELIHIFEDEWIEKQEIVKSILLNKLNKTPNKIFARKCHIKELTKDTAFNFLDSNHLQGFINGVHIGLYYGDILISCLTIGKSRFNKNFEYEILRFCSKNYHNVIGGLSKLFNYFTKKNNPNSIITYSDLRYGRGDTYQKINFIYSGRSNPNYYYLDENLQRSSRMKFQKHLLKEKLTQFDPILTEWENMQLNGYNRIWDCGNNIFYWKK